MTTTFRFASWNVHWFGRSREASLRKLDFLDTLEWDLLALQEVTPAMLDLLRERGAFDSSAYPQTVYSRFASALLAKDPIKLSTPSLLAHLPKPERGVWAVAQIGDQRVGVCSWHAPNAAGEGSAVKRAGYLGMIEWVTTHDGPLVIGLDGNHWATHYSDDFPGAEFAPWPDDNWADEHRFFGPDPQHRLHDAWHLYLDQHPDVLERVRRERPNGPSAVSYQRGRRKPVLDRFDYIFVSPEISVGHVAYKWDESRAAGSDHALVMAELTI